MSVISLSDLSLQQIESIFIHADFFKTKPVKPLLSETIVANIFFEPSTRTRLSFEMASLRLGAKSVLLSGIAGTSLEKEESLMDTVLNISAMKPSAMIIRCGDMLDLRQFQSSTSIPIINAGWGTHGHPTQALLDIASLRSKGRTLAHEKILFVGDIKHSRVVASHIELAAKLNYQIAFCGPEAFMPKNSEIQVFKTLKEGMNWASTVYFLRVQKERHQPDSGSSSDSGSYQLNGVTLKDLKEDGFFMHPGPVNWGTEMTNDTRKDPRSLILDQVYQGVFIRMAIIYLVSRGEL